MYNKSGMKHTQVINMIVFHFLPLILTGFPDGRSIFVLFSKHVENWWGSCTYKMLLFRYNM